MLTKIRIFFVNQFGFSRKESNGVLILIMVIILTWFIPRFFTPKPSMSHANEDEMLLREWYEEVNSSLITKRTALQRKKFPFDPNTATIDELRALGFKENVAKRIVNYRKAGGLFASKIDLRKIYGVDPDLLNSLENYILIKTVQEHKSIEPVNESLKPEKKFVKIDLNLADTVELKKIYGVGSVLSNRIVRFREKLGGFYHFDQLGEVYHLSDTLLPKFEARYFVGGQVELLNINSATEYQFRSHPYISSNLAMAIVNYRERHGSFDSLPGLMNIEILSDSVFQKVKPYLTISAE